MKNKIIYILLLVIVIEGLFFAFRPNLGSIRTDSGWDSSYDSGGSSDWGSSSSSWDYDSGSSSSSGEFTNTVSTVFEVFLSFFYFSIIYMAIPKKTLLNVVLNIIRFVVMVALEAIISKYLVFLSFILIFPLFYFLSLIYSKASKSGANVASSFNDVPADRLEKYGITDLEALKQELYKIFVDVQIAWMNFDYDTLSKLCGDELYNSYKSDLEMLNLKNGKNIMDSFRLMDVKVYNIFKTSYGYSLNVYMQVEFHDYVINTKTNKVIRGDKNRLFQNQYKLTFVKNTTTIDKCPSCGATIKDLSNQKCEHCGNTIVNNNTNYVLENKGMLQ